MKKLLLSTVSTLLLQSSLLHITTSTVYTVTPDDHYYPNTTFHHCHNLHHYLLNVTKYFTSNTQLLFLPGLHHLHTNLTIQNVHNISLIGSTANGTTPDTVIQCNSSVAILMTNITDLAMKNLLIRNCTTNSSQAGIRLDEHNTQCVMLLFNCFRIHMQCIEIYNAHLKTGLLAYNILGNFTLSKIKSKGMKIVCTDDYINSSIKFEQSVLNINHFELIAMETKFTSSNNNEGRGEFDYEPINFNNYLYNTALFDPFCIEYYAYISYLKRQTSEITDSMKTFGIKLEIRQTTYSVSVYISNATFQNLHTDNLDSHMHFLSIELNGCNNSFRNIIYIQGLNFVNNTLSGTDSFISISSLLCNTAKAKEDIIKMLNCNFIGNTIAEMASSYTKSSTLDVYAEIYVSGCLFQYDLLPFLKSSSLKHGTLIIENSKFEFIVATSVIELSNVQLVLIGPVIFCNIRASQLIKTNTNITIYNYIECSYMQASTLVSGSTQTTINLIHTAYVNITNSHFNGTLFQLESNKAYSYPICPLQYYLKSLNPKRKAGRHSKGPLIAIESNNNVSDIFDSNIGNINCKWDPKSMYYGSNPLKIYEQNIQLTGEGNNNYKFDTGLLCLCFNTTQLNCFTNTLGPIYPGQTIEFCTALNSKVTNKNSIPITVKIYDKDIQHSLCIVKSVEDAEKIVTNNCTTLVYNIFSENQPWCKLILYNIEYKFPTIYFIQLLECPAGFALDNVAKRCDCDQTLISYGIVENCNINDQTILRPANSWISATTHNNSYTYHISLHCPFHYCLPHSSHLNFSTPNSQCQFNRSGLLCGHCQQGYSTVFSSYYCQHCSNVYLLLIIPIAIAGLTLVLLLFYLNLTVTDGSINAFILYANIISINTPLFFTSINTFTLTYTFISLANLDLGIQTCFYNGMDDYAKMWLQLAFPFYLIFIATLIIITSRYSTTIQRLTARRALPVLATLFLLSYTKILRIVSSVLFSYSTITHIPSKHSTLVWSVDASVPVFGVRFTILFVVCIILFCILIPFNVILVFTKTLSRFNLINKFIPLIDAYRGPYEYKLYYWTGFQLTVRSVYFGISALSRNVNLALGIVLLSVIIAIHGIMYPYKSTIKNLQELLYLLNLQALYVISLYGQDTTNMTAVNILIAIAALQFSIILTYNIITYTCDGVIRKRIQTSVNMLTTCISRSHDEQQYELDDNLRCQIPDITYNYQEYREPLICQD